MKLNLSVIIIAIFLFISCTTKQNQDNLYTADVIIYGGTSAAVIAAVELVHSGKTVLVRVQKPLRDTKHCYLLIPMQAVTRKRFWRL
jgi:hypothetical protein